VLVAAMMERQQPQTQDQVVEVLERVLEQYQIAAERVVKELLCLDMSRVLYRQLLLI